MVKLLFAIFMTKIYNDIFIDMKYGSGLILL